MTRRRIGPFAILAAAALFWTSVAWIAWPAWDDGWLWLAAQKLGPASLRHAHGDRPLFGWIEATLLTFGATRTVSAAAHATTWFATGAVTMTLHRRLFPNDRDLGVVAGLLAVSPVFSTTQIVLVNPTWSGSLPALLVWAPLVLVAPLGAEEDRVEKGALRMLAWALAAVSILLGCALSEYAVASGLAGGTLVALFGAQRDRRGGAWKVGTAVVALVLAGYVVLRSTVHAPVRASIAPSYLLHHLVARGIAFPFLLVSDLWQALAGTVLAKLGGVRLEQAGMERVTILAGGMAVAAGVATSKRLDVLEGADAASSPGDLTRVHLALSAALAAGLAPFCLTSRLPGADSTSRYWIPVLPVACVLSLSVLRRLVRSSGFERFVPPVLAGLSVYWSVVHAGSELKDRSRVRHWARALAPHVAAGPTLVVMSSKSAWPPYARDYELTARLRLDMPRDPSRGEVWAELGIPDSSGSLRLLRAPSDRSSPPRLEVGWYHVTRLELSLGRVLWATVNGNGNLTIVEDDYSNVASAAAIAQ